MQPIKNPESPQEIQFFLEIEKEDHRVNYQKIIDYPASYPFHRKEADMLTILVVEDEPNVRKLVVVNLLQRGYKVLEAENGQKAIDLLSSQKPSLVILDIKLPDLSGWNILDYMGTVPTLSDLPVLVMTATPLEHPLVLKKYPCIIDILVKPFNTTRLIGLIQNTLAKN